MTIYIYDIIVGINSYTFVWLLYVIDSLVISGVYVIIYGSTVCGQIIYTDHVNSVPTGIIEF